MTDTEVLKNAPIVEAVLDIRVPSSAPIELATLEKFEHELRRDYPSKRIQVELKGRVRFGGAEAPAHATADQQQTGFQFSSRDGNQVVQVRRNGFSFSRLKPYRNWESFNSEAKDLWSRFIALTKTKRVDRIALRYINRLELPLPIERIDEYLRTYPEVADGLPNTNTGFFLRLVLTDDDLRATAVVTETTEGAYTDPAILRVLLDIDVFRSGPFGAESNNLWRYFSGLREFKDRIFFRTLTDKTLDLYR